MPFQSEAQSRLCWLEYNRAKQRGEKPKWDCREWEKETPKGKLPHHKKSKMPNFMDIYICQQDLETFDLIDILEMAKYYNCPTNLKKRDLCWLLAYTLMDGTNC